ncbi:MULTISPECIES: class I adenylate-forming enzyme family protein [Nocardiaceae]|uniref:Long-chain acyl-CoA synthetase n=1 Tax=Rhodococcoides corynebacterioides TaxID=53972 RepID=A0ABS2KZM9_9NOCA|nr:MULTISPECIES: class I adenylate-forming enzyme family protein [Rhodococcus]MBM7417400.1 long-chain acyl-CoA synthetase [Rhodococcus corynebacterioides]MBP1115654.1 long-chain acyl-CoA synthetase [Rhodococcus sp. PvP016]
MDDRMADYLAVLENSAAETPDHPALIDEGGTVGYRDMMTEVGRRADVLVRAGMVPRQRVALVAENSARFLISALAVWKAGGALVTIYPSSAKDDLSYSIASADPALVLVDRVSAPAVADALTDHRPTAMIDGEDFTVNSVRADTAPSPDHVRARLRLITYSSGTTNRPKAIMVSDVALLNGAETFTSVWHLGREDRTVVALPMAWLFGLASTSMATLYAGGTVIALRRSRPQMILDAIADHRGTFLGGVTTMFTKLVRHLDTTVDKPDMSSLRLCVSGGEARNDAAFDRWASHTSVSVLDNYCATECFPLVTYDPTVDPTPVRGAAGTVVPTNEFRVVDDEGREVERGMVGEAQGRGPGLMLGYWDDPTTTAEAMVDGWYRMRDLVRVDERGYVHVVGRLSDMIIRGGSNISPAEVERVLHCHASVRAVAVVGLPDEIYGQKVVAAVVLADGAALDADALGTFAAEQLASFKVPTEYVVLDALPQNTTSGKVDRRAVTALLAAPSARS